MSQSVTVISSLVLLPLVVGRIGVVAYGALTLATSLAGLLQSLDGGMLNAATRYFGISAGARDNRATADHLITITTAALGISGGIAVVVFLLAPDVPGLFNIDRNLHAEIVFAVRAVAILLPLGMLQGVVSALLTANGRFLVLARANVATRLIYVITVVVFVQRHDGVQIMMRILLLVQAAGLVAVGLSALGLVHPLRGRLLPRAAIREIAAYSFRIQLAGLTAVANLQLDALIVGAVLPLRYVALYGIGATVATQLRSVPLNVSGPLVARLTQTLGRAGDAATFAEYARIQTSWSNAVTAFGAVTIGASLFQIEAWLGPGFTTAGIVAVILGAGNMVNLLTLPLTVYLQAIGRPDLDLRYGMLAAGLNLALTIAFIWVGLYGIVGGTAVGVAIGSIALIWLARRAVTRDIPSFLTGLPWRAGVSGLVSAAASGAALSAVVPWHGMLGLILVSMCVLPGLVGFALAFLGLDAAALAARDTVRDRSLNHVFRALAAPAESSQNGLNGYAWLTRGLRGHRP